MEAIIVQPDRIDGALVMVAESATRRAAGEDVRLEFHTQYERDWFHVIYHSDSPSINRVHEIIVNRSFPLDVPEIFTNPAYREFREFIAAAVANNSETYWTDREAEAA